VLDATRTLIIVSPTSVLDGAFALIEGHPVYSRGALPLSCARLCVIKYDGGRELWRDTSGGNYSHCLRRLFGVSPPQVSTPFLVQRAFSCSGLREQVPSRTA